MPDVGMGAVVSVAHRAPSVILPWTPHDDRVVLSAMTALASCGRSTHFPDVIHHLEAVGHVRTAGFLADSWQAFARAQADLYTRVIGDQLAQVIDAVDFMGTVGSDDPTALARLRFVVLLLETGADPWWEAASVDELLGWAATTEDMLRLRLHALAQVFDALDCGNDVARAHEHWAAALTAWMTTLSTTEEVAQTINLARSIGVSPTLLAQFSLGEAVRA